MVKEIIEKRKLAKNSYYSSRENVAKESDKEIEEALTLFLQEKWARYIKKGWYGFMGLGSPTPLSWMYAIDDFLKYAQEKCPDFKILQVKVKRGAAVLYLEGLSKDVERELEELCYEMSDENLIY